MSIDKKIVSNNKNSNSPAVKHDAIPDYYDENDILDELEDEEIEIRIEKRLKNDILSGKRNHRMPGTSKRERSG